MVGVKGRDGRVEDANQLSLESPRPNPGIPGLLPGTIMQQGCSLCPTGS